MSGHSKWAQIKRQKETNDKARSALFSKLSRAITLAVLEGGGIEDPAINARLRFAISRARTERMGRDTITRAIAAAKSKSASLMKEVVYEAFGPHGSLFIIYALTENPNRTNSDIRTILDRNGAKIGVQGSVMHQFIKCAVVRCRPHVPVAQAFEMGDKWGALDLEESENGINLYVSFDTMGKVGESDDIEDVALYYRPVSPIELTQDDVVGDVIRIVQKLEDLDDVQHVFTNISDE